MANAILPAHLGEFLRAYAIGKKEGISGSSVFATIVVERVVDVLTLVLLMGLVLMVYPFPNTMKISAYLTVALAIGIVGILAFLKLKPEPTLGLIRTVTKPLPHKMGNSLFSMVESFGAGITALQRGRSYIIFTVLSIIIWCCYAGVLVLGFYALDLIKLYNIPIGASLVVLIMTTVAILVPSAPGYIGTYHWLCMLALGFFGVPKSAALGYAIIIHAISGIPVALVGVAFALREGISVSKIGEEGALKKMAVS